VRPLLVCAIVIVAALGAALAYGMATRTSAAPAIQHPPAKPFAAVATWPAGARPAPAFALRDQHGKPVSIASLRGRTAIVTFVDPVCRTLCPLEGKVLVQAARSVPAGARPAIVAVSVNPAADTAANFARAATDWRLGSAWRWGVGTHRQLARVWKDYDIAVAVQKGDVVHTEAAYVVDATGHERALFLWPFSARDVAQLLRTVATR
jgi:cytochrome oxidase Cu insertion factor (SCO1/SenC/PrrC family)